ncbi:MAG: efflux RND transporter permease subunit [Pseudomonadales bacterium]|nr:efflux RND transporter permease subunit [Pseudomonadales bacterium]
MQDLKVSTFRWVVDHPWIVLFVSLSLFLAVAYQLKDFRTDNDIRALFNEENPDYLQLKTVEDTFTTGDNIIFAVAPKSGDIFNAETLKIVTELTNIGWQMQGALRVDSLSNFQHTQSVGEDDLLVDYLYTEETEFNPQTLSRIKKIALSEPSLVNAVVSSSGHVTAVSVTIQSEVKREYAQELTLASREIVKDFQSRYPTTKFYLSGSVIFGAAMAKASSESIQHVMPLALAAVIVAFSVLLRSVAGTIATLLIVAITNISTMGIAVVSGVVFQPITMFAPVIVMTLAVADCLHILVTYNHLQRQGQAKKPAMVESLRINFQPVMLTSVTTAIGFIGLNAADTPPFVELGNMVATGVTIAFILSLTLLPALMMLLPSRRPPEKEDLAQVWMEAFARQVIKHKKSLLVVVSLVLVAVGAMLPRNAFNDVWTNYFDENFQVRVDNEFITRELAGMHRFEIALPAKEENGVHDIEYLQNLEKFSKWLHSLDHVVSAVPFSELHKRLNRTFHGDRQEFYELPEEKTLAAQYFLLYEMSLPMGLDIQNQVSFDRSQTRYLITMRDLTASEVRAMGYRIEDWVTANLPEYMHASVTGVDFIMSGVSKRNSVSMISGTLVAMILISACIMLALRSFRYGLMSLLPNLLPAAAAFGLWGLIDGHLNLASSVVACLTIGIVVDDTVHLLSKYVRARREQNYSAEEAVFYAFKTVGVALVSTSIILVSCFGVQAFSHFGPESTLGTLTSITIFFALLVDFLFFVPFLLVFDQRANSNGTNSASANSDSTESSSYTAKAN